MEDLAWGTDSEFTDKQFKNITVKKLMKKKQPL